MDRARGAVNGYRVRPMEHRRNIQLLVHRSDSRNRQPESRNADRSLLVRAAFWEVPKHRSMWDLDEPGAGLDLVVSVGPEPDCLSR